MPDLQRVMAMAASHHQSGRLAEAEGLYSQVLEANPNNIGALASLGALYLQTRRKEQALELLAMAASQSPDDPKILNSLGMAHLAAEELDKAQTCFERALALEPGAPEILTNLGSLMCCRDRADKAIELFQAALSVRPGHAPDHHNLGNAQAMAGDMSQAAASYRRCLELDPENAKAWNNLGGALKHLGRSGEAKQAMEQALLLDPLNPMFTLNLAGFLLSLGLYSQAEKRFEQTASLQPRNIKALSGLGIARFGQGRAEEAVMNFMEALTIDEEAPEALSNLGAALRQQGELEPSLDAYEGALAADPDYVPALAGQGQTRLLMGDSRGGWKGWEARRRNPRRPVGPDLPLWDGSPLHEEKLLVWCDGGSEDSLTFLRLLPLAREKCAGIVLIPPAGFEGLSQRIPAVDSVLASDEPIPGDCRFAAPLLSLGAILGVQAENIPQEPFIFSDTDRAAKALAGLALKGKRIGIAWRDARSLPESVYHHLPEECLASLQDISGIDFVLLHEGTPPTELPATQMAAPQKLEDVLGLMSNLDLVICCEGLHAELAAGAGIEAWVLLSPGPSWSWGLDQRSPWHPGARIFRSPSNQDWSQAGSELAEALLQWLGDS